MAWLGIWMVGAALAGGADAERVEVDARDVKNRYMPHFRYPDDPAAWRADESVCRVRFFVDAKGATERVERISCADPFWAEVEPKAGEARFRPAEVDGTPVPSQFVLLIRFRIADERPEGAPLPPGELVWFALGSPVAPLASDTATPPFGLAAELGFRGAGRGVVGFRLGADRWAPLAVEADDGSLVRSQVHGFVGVDLLSSSAPGWDWNAGLLPSLGLGLGMTTDRSPGVPVRRPHGLLNAGGEAWLGKRLGGEDVLRLALWGRTVVVPGKVRAERIAPVHLGVSLGIGGAS